jgi:hypothetical protein
MSDVARQYNLIGETLRQGIGDLLQGQAAGKALDIQAMKMGIESEDRKHRYAMENKRYKMEAEKHDHVIAAYKRAEADPVRKKNEAIAQTQLDLANKDATRGTLGIDTLWETEIWDDVWAEKVYKQTGIREHEGVFWQWEDGKPKRKLKHGELAQNTDVAGIMLANMDPLHHVRKTAEYETAKLEMMQKNKPEDGLEQEIWQAGFDAQKDTVERLNTQIEDMKAKPIKYLNAQIDTLGTFIQNSLDPTIHAVKYKELLDRRNGLIEQQNIMLQKQGKGLKHVWLYRPNGDPIQDFWIRPGESLAGHPDAKIYKKMHKLNTGETLSFDTPYSAKQAGQVASAIFSNSGMKFRMMQKLFAGDDEGASDDFRGMLKAINNATGTMELSDDDYKYRQVMNNFKDMGLEPRDGSITSANKNEAYERLHVFLKKKYPKATTEELEQRADDYYDVIDVAAEYNDTLLAQGQ